ncbi:MAG: DUF6677 family protein [Acidobacteriota bacterium]
MPTDVDTQAEPQSALPLANPFLAAFLAWIIPGLGHGFLGRWRRAVLFFALVLASIAVGHQLDGQLPNRLGGPLLGTLGTLGSLGAGAVYLLLVFGMGYAGEPTAAGFDYGRAFLVTGGLMNLLLVLDAWDIAWGKELPAESPSEASASEDETSDDVVPAEATAES